MGVKEVFAPDMVTTHPPTTNHTTKAQGAGLRLRMFSKPPPPPPAKKSILHRYGGGLSSNCQAGSVGRLRYTIALSSLAVEPSAKKSKQGATMSAHFDGGAEITGRRLREVEVSYVDDPTLDMGAEDSDDCPASPPPTYYLRVREEKRSAGTGRATAVSGIFERSSDSSSESDSCDGQVSFRLCRADFFDFGETDAAEP